MVGVSWTSLLKATNTQDCSEISLWSETGYKLTKDKFFMDMDVSSEFLTKYNHIHQVIYILQYSKMFCM